jgi:hypothetical protein
MGSVAQAERPRGISVPIPEEFAGDDYEPTQHNSKIIFLNRCEGGCVLKSGGNDSRTNRTFIGRPGTISEWGKGDEQWDELVKCVQALYDPYDLIVTDVDPGPNVPHFESITAGRANEIGVSTGVLGVAPAGCRVVNNSISFTFANEPYFANGISGICSTVGQETAHSFGLDHEYLCSDPMTYLPACEKQYFQDTNASCGEDGPRQCSCGNQSQNSHRMLYDHFGAGPNPGPKLKFKRPLPNTNVEGNFIIEVDDDDYFYDVTNVEVWVNGEIAGMSSTPPYIFNAPAGLSGITNIELRGTDTRGYQGTVAAEVNVGSPCGPGDCTEGRVCYKSFCIAGANEAGGFGSACESDDACDSKICAREAEGPGSCTELCDLAQGQCPSAYGCTEAGLSNVCWPGVSEDSGGCGCNSGNSGTGFAGLFFIALLMTFQRRRSRQA